MVLVGLARSGCSVHSIVWQAEVENNVSFVFPYGFLCRSSFMDQRLYLGIHVFKNNLNFNAVCFTAVNSSSDGSCSLRKVL